MNQDKSPSGANPIVRLDKVNKFFGDLHVLKDHADLGTDLLQCLGGLAMG